MATEAEFWGRPLAPDPLRVDPARTAARARIVREALRHIATDPECCATLPLLDRKYAFSMADTASDETLAKLAGLLKHG